jgi:hypothetical protein
MSDEEALAAKRERDWKQLRCVLERDGHTRPESDHELVRAALGTTQHENLVSALDEVQRGTHVARLQPADLDSLLADVLLNESNRTMCMVAVEGSSAGRGWHWHFADVVTTSLTRAEARRQGASLVVGIHRASVRRGQRWHDDKHRTKTLRLLVGG